MGRSVGSHCSCIGSLSWGLALYGGFLLLRSLSSSVRLGKKKNGGGGWWYAVGALTFSRHPTLQNSIKKFERELMLERHMALMKEKQVIVKRQQEEVNRLMQTEVGNLHRQVDNTCMDSQG